jgi:hypothetical protein
VKLIVISDRELWIGTQVLQVPQQYREQLARLIRESRIDVCYAHDAHRKEWYYAGNGVFVCGICERLGRIAS